MCDYRDLLGVRYTPHGRSREDGFDCYGLCIEVLRRNGITLPDLYYESMKDSEKICSGLKGLRATKIDRPEENCIVEITNCGEPSHMAVYIGDGLMIHTMIKTKVCIEPLKHYEHRINGYWRVND